eukprot:TRINITY_DN3960_c0_g1_i1.p1 TRINITY_DN3960_c0_g1~~TRINITY_DN3960_c0_g1_i1.p1  ORF type:complete len:535 (+),score=54.07 TRINITY_DN3960_c0_g1_i1:126-1730(+)
MNHRAAAKRVAFDLCTPVVRVDQPEDESDCVEWKLLLLEPRAFGEVEGRRFCAEKLGPNPINPWNKRWFVIMGKFLLWFPSTDATSRSLGCYFLPGLATVMETRGKKNYCLRVTFTTPRRPGDKWKELVIAGRTRAEVTEWESYFKPFYPSYTVGDPEPLTNVINVTTDTSGTTALGLHGLPAHWEAMFIDEGFTADDFTAHRNTLRLIVNFSSNTRTQAPVSHVSGKVMSGQYSKLPLKELVSPGDPLRLFTNLLKVDAGSQGEVYKAVRISDGLTVALKKIFIRKPEKEIPALENEIRIMKGSNHKNIINFFNCFQPVPGTLWIAMEYMAGGKLTDMIGLDNLYNDEDVAYVSHVLVDVLGYLHNHGLLHRDIKSDNVLVDPSGKLVLADFGFGADMADGRKKRETVVGTPYWMAPEVIRGEPYDDKADIWSLGILLLELVDGEPPNIHLSQIKVLYTIISSPPPQPTHTRHRLLHDFVSKILQSDHAARSPASVLIHHPFLAMRSRQSAFMSRRKVNPVTFSNPCGGGVID